MTSFSGPGEWYARWPHFRPEELSCRHCGELPEELDLEFLDALERLRVRLAKPIHVNSGHRCRIHNQLVGGAPYSQHKGLAADVSLVGQSPLDMYKTALSVGFLGVGLAESFIHLDMRREIDGYQPPRRLTIWKYQKRWPRWFLERDKNSGATS